MVIDRSWAASCRAPCICAISRLFRPAILGRRIIKLPLGPRRVAVLVSPHFLGRSYPQNTKTGGNNNGYGPRERDFRLTGRNIRLIEETQGGLIVAAVPQGMQFA